MPGDLPVAEVRVMIEKALVPIPALMTGSLPEVQVFSYGPAGSPTG
ncbi:hypothetical protein H5395_15750 [Paracoccus sp. MC1854]|nr:hypothetical protein [Paracoccus sp. MC1854]MBB1492944.1 hypothetical protein [Paracoccus sp. MC1854]